MGVVCRGVIVFRLVTPRRWPTGGPKSTLTPSPRWWRILVAHASDSTMSERHQSPRVRVPRGGALGPHIPRAVRAWLRSLVAVRGLLGAAGAARAARHAKMPARAAGRPEASRDTSPAVRAWLLRGDQEVLRACILSKVPVPWYRYLAAQRGRAAHVKARGPVARVSSERRSVSARSPLHRARAPQRAALTR